MSSLFILYIGVFIKIKITIILFVLALISFFHTDTLFAQGSKYQKPFKKSYLRINDFAFNLFHQIRNKDGNIFFSPYSIAMTLLLVNEGASGNTKTQIQNLFHVSEITDNLQSKLQLEIKVFNALWMEKDYSFLKDYLNIAESNYLAHLRRVDFKNQSRQAVNLINQWVENKTDKKVKNLIRPDAVDSLTRLVLTNVIYFKKNWKYRFDQNNTNDAPFFLTEKKTIYVPMMYKEAEFRYHADNIIQMVELLYENSDLSMIVLLPNKDRKLPDLEGSLDLSFLKKHKERLQKQEIQVFLPKFTFSLPYTLSTALKKMGMREAFTRQADFSKINGKKDLCISEVFHNAFIQVDEQGTEASAASGAIMGLGGTSQKPLFIADHPFVFFIMHRSSDTILFMGRVNNPL